LTLKKIFFKSILILDSRFNFILKIMEGNKPPLLNFNPETLWGTLYSYSDAAKEISLKSSVCSKYIFVVLLLQVAW
jgi:hypothetical protein